MPTTTTYLIPASNLPALTNKLDKLTRRASKLSVGAISYNLGATQDKPFSNANESYRALTEQHDIDAARARGQLVFVRFQEVTVSGEVPRLAGWEFVATLQHLADDKGEIINLLRTVPGFKTSLPEHFRTASPENCDHCQKVIKTRKETFVVRHEDGTWKQVGRNCTQDFLGGKDPHGVARALELLIQAGDEAEAASEFGGIGGTFIRYDTVDFLAVVALLIRIVGWTSRGKARNSDGAVQATADLALDYLNPPKGNSKAAVEFRAWVRANPVAAEDREIAEKASDFAHEDLSNKTARNDYEHNLWVATVQATVNHRLAGITASLIPYYLREVERKVVNEAEQRRTKDSQHLGTVGERLILDVQVAKIITVGEGSEWGPSYLHKLITANGDSVIWFSSNAGNNLKPGEKYSVKATVKKHDVRDGVKQTILNRLVELSSEEVAKELAKAARKAARAAKALGQ